MVKKQNIMCSSPCMESRTDEDPTQPLPRKMKIQEDPTILPPTEATQENELVNAQLQQSVWTFQTKG